jgi:adenosylcobinamide-phosphate synthase
VTGLSVGAGWSVAVVAAQLPFGWLLALVAQRGPFDEVHRMVRRLRSNDLHAAREAAAVFLGSNADTCDEAALVRAGTNHLAVQYLIGLVAAVFWFVLLGIPGLFVWRAVNVMGCLLDLSDPRQAYFGWVPTRFNDAAAYLPSLIAGLLIIVAAAFVPAANPVRALRVMLRDGSKHRSLSLGSPVAAMARAGGHACGGRASCCPQLFTARLEAEFQNPSPGSGNKMVDRQSPVQTLRERSISTESAACSCFWRLRS